mgnify:CR=1 FL=1
MTQVLRLLTLITSLLVIAACNPGTSTPSDASIIGTKAVIKAHGNELLLEIKNVAAGTIISEITDWNGQFVSRRHYYKGLYPIAGTEGATQWELDFDVTKIDSLFPLTVGNTTSFSGTMIDISNDLTYKFWSKIEVKAQKPFLLPSGSQEVYILKIKTEYDLNGENKRSYETIYYSPELQLNLKGVMHEEASQRYWRVVSVLPPSESGTVASPRRRRSGTVMI